MRRMKFIFVSYLIALFATSSQAHVAFSDSLSIKKTQEDTSKVVVTLTKQENKALGVDANIVIQASSQAVWEVLTDYDNLETFIPKLEESTLLEESGNKKIIQQTGRSSFLFIKKSARAVLKIDEEYLQRIKFSQIEGDFKIYRGEWTLRNEGSSTVLSYRAEIRPDFFAPGFITRRVQKRDLPLILKAIKNRAESTSALATK